jgi:hypothetical protein
MRTDEPFDSLSHCNLGERTHRVRNGRCLLSRPSVIAKGLTALGYPTYFPLILGAWKALGAVALVAPVHPLLREWAYAGFTFNYTGAMFSHVARKEYKKVFAPLIIFCILAISYFFNPNQLHF